MNQSNKPATQYLHKIAVIGDIGAGKTSFIKRSVHNIFSAHYKGTIGVDFAMKIVKHKDLTHRFQMWDIAGQERFGNMTRVYYKDAVGCFIVADGTRESTLSATLKWAQDFKAKVDNADYMPCYLIINKIDLMPEESSHFISNWIEQHKTEFTRIIMFSCKDCTTSEPIDEIFGFACNDIMDLYDKKILPVQEDSEDPEDGLLAFTPRATEPPMNPVAAFFDNITTEVNNLVNSFKTPVNESPVNSQPFNAANVRKIAFDKQIKFIQTEVSKNAGALELSVDVAESIIDDVSKHLVSLGFTCTKLNTVTSRLLIKW